MSKYLVSAVLIGLGLSILLSPTGQVPRAALAFGEYKVFVAAVLILIGALFGWLARRHGSSSIR